MRAQYAPKCCSYSSGYDEIRWDVVGCNLMCQFCWSPASRPGLGIPTVKKSADDVYSDTRRMAVYPSSMFIRFTGGEPTLQWNDILTALDLFEQDTTLRDIPVLIQTNGIEIGKGNASLDRLISNTRQLYLFELSFKGTNHEEFSLLTAKAPDLYQYQLGAYRTLAEISGFAPHIQVVAVLGIYHSAVKGISKYVFIEPESGEILFDDDAQWAPEFRQIWTKAALKWVEPLRMSPKGMWDTLLKRCGPEGSGVLKHVPSGIGTNRKRLFMTKPKSTDYAANIVQRRYW
ncbi:radical SAM protein [Candidatus Neomarinimicrobiota bacterium]